MPSHHSNLIPPSTTKAMLACACGSRGSGKGHLTETQAASGLQASLLVLRTCHFPFWYLPNHYFLFKVGFHYCPNRAT
jgi:hypothetical protein